MHDRNLYLICFIEKKALYVAPIAAFKYPFRVHEKISFQKDNLGLFSRNYAYHNVFDNCSLWLNKHFALLRSFRFVNLYRRIVNSNTHTRKVHFLTPMYILTWQTKVKQYKQRIIITLLVFVSNPQNTVLLVSSVKYYNFRAIKTTRV